MSCYCDYDPPTVYSEKIVVARLEHKCCECRRIIKPGEQYERVFGVWDGISETYKTCRICLDLREYVNSNIPCFCWMFTAMRDDALEELRAYSHELPGLFFGGARLVVKANRLAKHDRIAP